MRVFSVALGLLALVLLGACTKPVVWASDAEVSAARYRHSGPAEIMLFNVISHETGKGEHSALMISASERVLFDPAGSWAHREAPERHDLHHGFNDRMLFMYTFYHARRTHYVQTHRLRVSPEVAEAILTRARVAGPVPDSYCARSIATLLRGVEGFESLPVTWLPNSLSAAFAQLPGVVEEQFHSDREPTVRRAAQPQPQAVI